MDAISTFAKKLIANGRTWTEKFLQEQSRSRVVTEKHAHAGFYLQNEYEPCFDLLNDGICSVLDKLTLVQAISETIDQLAKFFPETYIRGEKISKNERRAIVPLSFGTNANRRWKVWCDLTKPLNCAILRLPLYSKN